MGDINQILKIAREEKAKCFALLKCQGLSQLISVRFLCKIPSYNSWGLNLSSFSGEETLASVLMAAGVLSPCPLPGKPPLVGKLAGTGLTSLVYTSSPCRQLLLLLMGPEKLWAQQRSSLQLPLGGSATISVTAQHCVCKK